MKNCKHCKKRSKNYQLYFYCTILKQDILFSNCKNCKDKEYKNYKPLKQRTSKRAKAENNRFSIITNDFTKCIECGKPKQDLHEIFRGRNRRTSIKWGMVIPLCRACHVSSEIEAKWRIKGQQKFMQHYDKTIDEFIDIFGRNYTK